MPTGLNEDGEILYALIAFGSTVFVEYTNPKVEYGNFPRAARKILEKLPARDHKMSITYDDYMFHHQVAQEFVFMCMATSQYSHTQAYNFLDSIQELWLEKYGKLSREQKQNMNEDKTFRSSIKEKMNYYNYDPSANKFKKLKDKVNVVKEQMIENIDKVIERGEKIDILVGKTDELVQSSQKFKAGARTLKTTMTLRNILIIIIIIVFILLLVLGIFFWICGGVQCIISLSQMIEENNKNVKPSKSM